MTVPANEEILDLVDENDNVINQMSRREVYERNLHNFRIVYCFIQNDKGELWIVKRAATKQRCPNELDTAVGGHVSAGETYLQAILREIKEELDWDVAEKDLELLGTLTPQHDGTFAYSSVYLLRTNNQPPVHPKDFSAGYWLLPAKVYDKQAEGEVIKSDLLLLLERFWPSKQ